MGRERVERFRGVGVNERGVRRWLRRHGLGHGVEVRKGLAGRVLLVGGQEVLREVVAALQFQGGFEARLGLGRVEVLGVRVRALG